MTEREALIAAIVAKPDEDTPRLAFADYLDETGDPTDAVRATFIRQKYPASFEGRTKETLRWSKYTKELLADFVPKSWMTWLIETPGSPSWENLVRDGDERTWASRCGPRCYTSYKPPFVVSLRHGFVAGVATAESRFFKIAADLFRSQPIEWAVLNGARPDEEREHFFWGRRSSAGRSYWTLPESLFNLLQNGETEHLCGRECRVYSSSDKAYESLETACLAFGRHAAVAGLTPTISHTPRMVRIEPVPPAELIQLLTATCRNPEEDEAWVRVANWLDTNHPGTTVERRLPVGFNRFCCTSNLMASPSGQPYWSNTEILDSIEEVTRSWVNIRWFNHGGRSAIAGLPVLVGEPSYTGDLISIARSLQAYFRCPVSFARQSFHHRNCVRFVVWFSLANLFRGNEYTSGSLNAPHQP